MAYKYSFQTPDGQTIEFDSPTMLTREQARRQAYGVAEQRALQQQQLEQTAEESRGFFGAARDVGLGLGAGILGPIGEDLIGGGLTLLGAEELGQAARETFGEDAERLREMQTPQLQARQQLAQQRIAEVEGEGFGTEFSAAALEYLRNPSLLFQLGAEQLPQLIPIARAGRLARGVVSNTLKEATEQTLNRAGLGGAAAAAGALQGSSVGMETYDRVFDELTAQGLSEEQASEQALAAAQRDALQTGAITIGTTFAIPGAGTVERAVVGRTAGRAAADLGQAAPRASTLRGAATGFGGEALQEGIEEGSAAYISNLSALEAGADIDPFAGVGTQAGIGSLVGGLFGGPFGAIEARGVARDRARIAELKEQQQQEERARTEARQARGEMEQQPLPGFEPGAQPEAAGPPAPEPTPAPDFELEPTADLETTERQGELDLQPAAPAAEPARVPTGQRGFDFRSEQEQLAAVEQELAEFDQTYGSLSRSDQRRVRRGLQQERDRLRNRLILQPRPAEAAAATFEAEQPDLLGFYQTTPEVTPAVEAEAATREEARARIEAARRRREGETFGGPQRELELGRPVEPVTLTEERLAEFGLPAQARRPDRVRANFKKIAQRFEGLDLTDPDQRAQVERELADIENRDAQWVAPFSQRMRQELQATEQQAEAVRAERERVGLAPDIQEDVSFAVERGMQEEQAARARAQEERRAAEAQTAEEQRRAELRQQLVDRQAERVREQARGRVPLTEEWKDAARRQLRQRQEEAQMRERGLDEMAAQEAADFELDMQYVDERAPQLEPDQKVAASDFVQQYTTAQAINDPELTRTIEQEARNQLGRQQWGRIKSGLTRQRRAQQRRLEQEERGELQPEQPDLFAQPERAAEPEPEPTPEPEQGELFEAVEAATEAAETATEAAQDVERAAEDVERGRGRRGRRGAVRRGPEPAADERGAEPSVEVGREREPEPTGEPEPSEDRGVGRDRAPAERDVVREEPSDLTLEELPAIAAPLQRAISDPTEANTNTLLNQANQDGILSDEQLEDFRQKIQQGEQARAKAIMHVFNEARDYEYFTANPRVALNMDRQIRPIRQAAGVTRAATEAEIDAQVQQEIGPVDDIDWLQAARENEQVIGPITEPETLQGNQESRFYSILRNYRDNRAALRLIADSSLDAGQRDLARRLLRLVGPETRVGVVPNPESFAPLQRAYGVTGRNPETNRVTILLREDVGMNPRTFLHENIHAALISRYGELENYLNTPSAELEGSYLDTYRDLYKEFQTLANEEINRLGLDAPAWLVSPARSSDEFITYALTSPELQAWLKSKPYPQEGTLWQKFKGFIQQFLGISGREPTWLDAALGVSSKVLEAAQAQPTLAADTDIVFSRAPFVNKQLSKAEDLKKTFSKLINRVKDTVEVEVVQSIEDVVEFDIPRGVRGFYHNGKAYIIADAVSEFDFETVLAHEVVGHAGMEGLLGRPAFSNLITQVKNLKTPRVEAIREHIRREYTNQQGEFQLDDNQLAREVIAHIAESKASYLSDSGIRRVWDNIVRRVRAALAKLGFVDPSDVLLDQLVYEAALHVEGGRNALRKSRAFLRPETMAAHTMQRAWDKGYRGFDLDAAGQHIRDIAEGRKEVPDPTQEDIETAPLDDSFYDQVVFSRRAEAARPVNDGFDSLADARAPSPQNKRNHAKDVKDILTGQWRLRDNLRVRMVDAAATVEDKIMRLYNNGVSNAEGIINPMVSYVQALRAEGLAAAVLRAGSLKLNKKTGLWEAKREEGVPSLTDVNAELGRLGDRIGHTNAVNRFHAATIAQRELEIDKNNAELQRQADAKREQGKQREASQLEEGIVDLYPNMDGQQIAERQRENRELVKLFAQYPELQNAFDMFTKFKNGQIDAMVEAGVVSREKATELKENAAYVPFNRLLEDADPGTASGYEVHTSGLMRIGEVKRLRGSPREVDNILDNMAKLSMWMTQAAVRNHAARELARGLREVEQDSPGTGIKAEYDSVEQIPAADRPNAISWKENGKLKFAVPHDPLDAFAWRGTESANIPMLRPFAAFANFLRKGITLSPDFILSQLQQDTFRVYAFGGLKNGARGGSRVAASWWRIRQDLRRGTFGEENLNRYGIVGQYDYMPEQARQTAEAEAIGEEVTFASQPLAWLIRWGERNAEASDLAQRKAVYDQTLADTNNETLAFWRASEIINFNRRGTSQFASVLRQVIPFMNAYAQGMNVLGKSMVGRGLSQAEKKQALGVFWGAMMKLSVLSGLYALMNSDDEEYVNQPPHIRTRFFLIPTGDDRPAIKLAMPADLAFITKALPEAAVMGMMRNDIDSDKAVTELRDAFMTAVSGPNFTPQLVKPSLEAMVNYNFFTGAPIVGMGEQYKQVEDQYRESTSQLARLFSNVGISPLVADHLLKGYLGTLGSNALVLTDIAYEEATGTERTQRELADLPISRVFFNRTQGTGFKQDFYKLRDEVRAAVGSLNLARDRGDVERIEAIMEDSQRLLQVRRQVNQVENTIEKSNRRIREIQDSNLSAEEKRERINREREFQSRLAGQVRRMRRFVYDE